VTSLTKELSNAISEPWIRQSLNKLVRILASKIQALQSEVASVQSLAIQNQQQAAMIQQQEHVIKELKSQLFQKRDQTQQMHECVSISLTRSTQPSAVDPRTINSVV
jgi:predicted ribosome quality control (RQC) complex YloA/Tae2 family protein